MPAMEAFGRRWHIGSDDLPLPMISLMSVHVIWCAAEGWCKRRLHAELSFNSALLFRL